MVKVMPCASESAAGRRRRMCVSGIKTYLGMMHFPDFLRSDKSQWRARLAQSWCRLRLMCYFAQLQPTTLRGWRSRKKPASRQMSHTTTGRGRASEHTHTHTPIIKSRGTHWHCWFNKTFCLHYSITSLYGMNYLFEWKIQVLVWD